jgi:hypothetical protein
MTVLVTAPLNPHRMVTHAKAGFRIPQDPLILTATTTSTSPSPISTSVHAAFADPIWRTAMEEEYGALMRNGTWELVPGHRQMDIHAQISLTGLSTATRLIESSKVSRSTYCEL